MRRLALAVLPLAFLATACQPGTTELTEEQITTIEAEVNAVANEALAAIVAMDVDRHLNFYANSHDLTVAVYGVVRRSFSTWAELVRTGFSEMESVETCAFSDEVVQVLAADVAVFTADFGCTGTAVGGGPLVGHTVTGVMVKRDGEWKCVNFSETFAPPESSEDT